MKSVKNDKEFEDAVKNYKEANYTYINNVYVYKEPVKCYYEVWLATHDNDFYILVPSDFNMEDTTIYAFSKDLESLKEYAKTIGGSFTAFRW